MIPPMHNKLLVSYYEKVEIMVPKVPKIVLIGGKLVENWWKIDEKRILELLFYCFSATDKG